MMTIKKYDVGIIGSGPAGLAAAQDLKKAGKSVVVIEKYLWGGTCPNYGCDPKKLLLAAVEAKESVTFLADKGVKGHNAIDWSALMAHKTQFTSKVSESTLASLATNEIDHVFGQAQFVNYNTVKIGATDTTIKATDWVIAVGQRPAKLTIPGADLAIDSEAFLSLATMPKAIAIIGGGYIAFEFAAIAAGAGAEVHLIVHNQRPLKQFNEELVKRLVNALEKRGVIIHYNMQVSAISQDNHDFVVHSNQNSGIKVGKVISAVGRLSNADTLALNHAGVMYEHSGVRVNQYLRTTNPHIYAVGDVANSGVAKLTPVGAYEGRYVAKVIVNAQQSPINYPAIPVVVYGTPKLAQVGVTLEQAENQPNLTSHSLDMTNWFSYYRMGEPVVHAKIILDDAGVIVGATVIGTHADELINYLTSAINQKANYQDVTNHIYAYPTIASDLPYFF
ncbi:dihydrolipoyl dehydrogenase family protein [Leuconostoc citreum]|uniref:dihydrolipoyl dehydrogenase family protein n=1 Tax=Leuconostoc citreum TaxID=33964 RepID=UPI002153677C|nr:NAD(P)/FAD-dependent oxidoreductase [Leuconostoc citreum]